MSDQKVISGSTGFNIPRKSVDAKTRDLVIKLTHTDKYDVYQKDLPANLPAGYTWINNFGLKERPHDSKHPNKTLDTLASHPFADSVDAYTIELDDIEGLEPVYFDGKSVRQFSANKTHVGNNRVHVTLALGDPPIGWPKN